nr:hypothetical protein [Tanacetum cinerariifolium]
MPSLFANTHNVVAILEKSDASEGFAQIIDFLSRSYIHYALTMSPHIYISYIKLFWNTAVVKCSGDVTSTAMASVVICLSKGQRFNFSRYIFDSLVRNVDSSSKFYMYPCFIQLIIQAQVVDLSSYTTRYISPALTQKVFANIRRVGKDDVDQENVMEEIVDDVTQPTSPLPPSPVIPSSPPHQSPRPSPPQAAEGSSILVQQVLDKCFVLVLRVEGLETANTAQQLEILKLKARVKKL